MTRMDRSLSCHRLSRRQLMLTGGLWLTGLPLRRGFAAEADAGAATSTGTGAGKTVVVTGSTDGLGKAVALQLAAQGARVIVHGRNRERGDAVVAEISRIKGASAKFYAADFASMEQVRKFADTLLQDCPRIDLLINNAGIGSANSGGGRERQLSADGFELRFAVNYLSGFLLTRRVLPRLIASAPARIVNVASLAQRPIDFANVMLEREYDGSRAYGQSKLAQILFTQDLALELANRNVSAYALHPATYMDTAMVRNAGAEPRSSVGEGADAVMQVATTASPGSSGQFFNGKAPMRANAAAYDEQARRNLRELSERLLQRWLA
jgi:NAD(P)-dependent dehydrogenase (short-subunit alcohol dehydrogenase family)